MSPGTAVAQGEVKRVDTVVCHCGALIQCSRAFLTANNGRTFWINIYAHHATPAGPICEKPSKAKVGAA
jgi:hypothetical protein